LKKIEYMVDKDFSQKTYRLIFTLMAMIIVVPMLGTQNLMPFFISACVYAFSRLPDFIESVQLKQNRFVFWANMFGIFACAIIVLCCFFCLAYLATSVSGMGDALKWVVVIFMIVTSAIDLVVFIFYIVKIRMTNLTFHQNGCNGNKI